MTIKTASITEGVALLHAMLRIRMVEERIVELYPQQDMRCPVHLCIGQEAVAVGVSHALSAEDLVVSGHRAHGHYLARGGDLKAMFAEMYGKATGCCQGRGGSMHLIDLRVNFLGSTPIVAGSIPVGVGVAFAEKMRGRQTVTAVYLGDAAMEEGVFHESLNFAALKQLNVMFVCENNLYSVYTHLKDRQPARDLSQWAAGHGVRTFKADGNDVMKVKAVAQEAVDLLRRGQGPVFLEFPTYRWREHCGPNYDNDIGYRDPREFEQWKELCPISRLQSAGLADGWLEPEQFQAMRRDISVEIDEAVAFAKDSPFASKDNLPKTAYAQDL